MMKSPTTKGLSRTIEREARRSPRTFWTARATAIPPIPMEATRVVTLTPRFWRARRTKTLQTRSRITKPIAPTAVAASGSRSTSSLRYFSR